MRMKSLRLKLIARMALVMVPFLWAVPSLSNAGSQDELKTVRVGVVFDGDWALLDSLVAAVQS